MNKPRVLITEPIAHEPSLWLNEYCDAQAIGADDEGFGKQLSTARGLVVRTYTQVDKDLLDRAPDLKVVGRAGVGLDNVDLEACAARGVRVVHTPRANAMAVVEYTISMLLDTLRPINAMTEHVHADQWHAAREAAITPGSVVDTTLGIVGMGHIGSRVARAAAGLGMKVSFNDLRKIQSSEMHGAACESFEPLLKQSRCLSVHVDGRAENRGLIGQHEFALMRPDVVLVNASRGFVVDPDAAIRFARANPDARLIFDVHDPEPISAGSELIGLGNVILTPHIAAATRQAKLAMSWVVRDVWAVLDGREPENPAD